LVLLNFTEDTDPILINIIRKIIMQQRQGIALEGDEMPVIETCITRPQHGIVVLPSSDVEDDDMIILDPHDRNKHQLPTVEVVKAHSPTQAYMKIESKKSKSLDHHAPGWGCVYFGVILPKVQEGVFICPTQEDARLVAIKRLSKAVVHNSLQQGKRENPYKEILWMQRMGDNYHVLGLIEALQDDRYLYIIMPYCERESLVEWIPWRRGVDENVARTVFMNILENLLYVHEHGIAHRDVSPDNCMVLNDRVVFNDLAMSFRIPPGGKVTGMGGFGKAAYLPPEVCLNLPFDAKGCDLWSAAVILFNLLTGEIAWTEPLPGNLIFRYMVLANGLARNPANERTVEILMDEPDGSPLKCLAIKCLEISPEAKDLLEGILKVAAHERWTFREVLSCPWVTNGL
jgi:serine/threonine protein kinase